MAYRALGPTACQSHADAPALRQCAGCDAALCESCCRYDRLDARCPPCAARAERRVRRSRSRRAAAGLFAALGLVAAAFAFAPAAPPEPGLLLVRGLVIHTPSPIHWAGALVPQVDHSRASSEAHPWPPAESWPSQPER
jgi:hypothetical protein